ncbi:hypothetical protein [Lactobacillus agrestimuris]|uniref:hypothetical protein n=1 Tax=Lactobacillus agrestimuris TaxID=2941328 RepID=UPI002042C4C9|nr:hypothetical protein [Lactobacillus agrestimuris]
MSKKAKCKINSIAIENDYIGSISIVNGNLDKFYELVDGYIKKSEIKIKKLERIIDLLKSSNALINDLGEKTKTYFKFYDLLGNIRKKVDSPIIKNKIFLLRRDLNYLPKIKTYILNSKCLNYGSFFDQIIEAYQTNFYYGEDALQSVGQRMEIITDSFSRVAAKRLPVLNNIEDLEKLTPGLKDNNMNMYYDIVSSWKYGDGRIIWHRNEDSFLIDSHNDFCKNFVATRDINEKKRQQEANKFYVRNNKRLNSLEDVEKSTLAALDGIAGQLYIKEAINMNDKNQEVDHNKFGKETLYEIPIYVWVLFIEVIQWNGRKILDQQIGTPIYYGKPVNNIRIYYKVRDLLTGFPNKYKKFIPKMLKKLTYQRDIYDAPFIFGDTVFLPICYSLDATYTIANLMNKCEKWENIRGHNFEKNIMGKLRETNYKVESNEKLVSDKSHKKEIDIIFRDKDDKVVIMECKTFSSPHSLKYYKIENDSMYTNLYVEHAKNNFSYFSKLYSQSYCVFLVDQVFPSSMVKKWSKELDAIFVYYKDFEKIINILNKSRLLDIQNKTFTKDKILEERRKNKEALEDEVSFSKHVKWRRYY